jgi:hypothetical protein
MRCALWPDLSELRTKREQRHLALLKKLVGDEEHWPWALEQARALTRHFADVRAIDGLGESADFSLSHGATQLAAEQVLADIGTFEAESGGSLAAAGLNASLLAEKLRRPSKARRHPECFLYRSFSHR